MTARVLAVLLALMFLGSALATQGSGAAAQPAHAQIVVPADDGPPAQPQAETASDAQDLAMQPAPARAPAAPAVAPGPWFAHALPAPFLDGLQRPPQTLRVTA